MKPIYAPLIMLLSLLGPGSVVAAATQASVPAATAPISEQQKIEILLSSIGRLQGAVFIRNGSEHSATEAVDHLRYKWKHAGDRVKTAEDFIVNCATKSSLSGLPYRIRFADGKTEDAAIYFEDQLKRMPAAPGLATSGSRR